MLDNIERMALLLRKAESISKPARHLGAIAESLHDLGYTIVPRSATDEYLDRVHKTGTTIDEQRYFYKRWIAAAEAEDED